MSNILNEEIRVMRHMISHLNRAIPLEPNQSKRMKMREDVKELESLIRKKLVETGEFIDPRIEEDVY